MLAVRTIMVSLLRRDNLAAFTSHHNQVLLLILFSLDVCCAYGSVVEDFKSFLAKRPPFCEIYYEVQDYGPFIQTGSTNSHWFGRVAGEDFLLRELPSAGVSARATNFFPDLWFAGRYGKEYWYFDRVDPDVYSWVARDGLPPDKRNGVYKGVRSGEDILSFVLNGGLGGVNIGSMTWRDNAFNAVSDITGYEVHGFLVASNELPDRMDYTIKTEKENYNWVSVYQYGKERNFGFFPDVIELYSKKRGKLLLARQVTVHSFYTTQVSNVHESFASYRAYTNSRSRFFEQRPEGLFSRDLGRIVRSNSFYGSDSLGARAIAPLVFAVGSVLLASSIVRVYKSLSRRMTNINNNNNSNTEITK